MVHFPSASSLLGDTSMWCNDTMDLDMQNFLSSNVSDDDDLSNTGSNNSVIDDAVDDDDVDDDAVDEQEVDQLDQWEYLTTTYDRDDFFTDSQHENDTTKPQPLMADDTKASPFSIYDTPVYTNHTGMFSAAGALDFATATTTIFFETMPSSTNLPRFDMDSSSLFQEKACNFDASMCGMDKLQCPQQQPNVWNANMMAGNSITDTIWEPNKLSTPPRLFELLLPQHQTLPFQSPTLQSQLIDVPSTMNVSCLGRTTSPSCSSNIIEKNTISFPLQPQPNRRIPVISPLTAYNYFYRNERDNIVHGMQHANDALPPPDYTFTPTKMEQLLRHHWTVDPFKKKRLHTKTHGFIEFTKLSRVISHRWRTLPEHGRAFYRAVANADQERYEQYITSLRQNQKDGATATSCNSNSKSESDSSVTASKTCTEAMAATCHVTVC